MVRQERPQIGRATHKVVCRGSDEGDLARQAVVRLGEKERMRWFCWESGMAYELCEKEMDHGEMRVIE